MKKIGSDTKVELLAIIRRHYACAMKQGIKVAALMLLCGAVTCLAGWDEFLQDTKQEVQEAKEGWEARKHHCVDCGEDEEKAQTCLSLMDSVCSLSNASDVDFDTIADIYDSMREIANDGKDDRDAD